MSTELFRQFAESFPKKYKKRIIEESEDSDYFISFTPITENNQGAFVEHIGDTVPIGGTYTLIDGNNGLYLRKDSQPQLLIENIARADSNIESFTLVDPFTKDVILDLVEVTS